MSNCNTTRLQDTKPSLSPSISRDQSQSPLFAKLPLDIRRHIYLQLWLDSGLTQHIYTFSKNSYLQSYPCLLDEQDWYRDPRPRVEGGNTTGGPDPQAVVAVPGEDQQPAIEQLQAEPYDDPGDIDAAIQDIALGPTTPATDEQQQPDTPWCLHRLCFERWIDRWDRSFSRAYSANYRGPSALDGTQQRRRRPRPELRGGTLLLPLLVCRRMYEEAAESMFSCLRFSFPALDALDRFVRVVPQGLTERVQFVDVSDFVRGFGFQENRSPKPLGPVRRGGGGILYADTPCAGWYRS